MKPHRKRKQYELAPHELRWLGASGRFVQGTRIAKDTRWAPLVTKYEDRILALLLLPCASRPTNQPLDREECALAAKMIIREVIRYVDHDATKVVPAKKVTAQLARFERAMERVTNVAGSFSKRTRNWIGQHLSLELERAMYDAGYNHVGSPPDAFEALLNRIDALAETASELRASYPVREEQHHVSNAVRLLHRRVSLIYFDATQAWPATSANAAWPTELDQPVDPNGKGALPPPLLHLLHLSSHQARCSRRSDGNSLTCVRILATSASMEATTSS